MSTTFHIFSSSFVIEKRKQSTSLVCINLFPQKVTVNRKANRVDTIKQYKVLFCYSLIIFRCFHLFFFLLIVLFNNWALSARIIFFPVIVDRGEVTSEYNIVI